MVELKDSGARKEFETGAVRDISEGKGRADLLALDIAAWLVKPAEAVVLTEIENFKNTGVALNLISILKNYMCTRWNNIETGLLELSHHFEDGAKKYSDNNWQKGMPVRCYIDSAVRHYLKWSRGDTDEPHDRAFCWNLFCAIWTVEHKPELNDYAVGKETNGSEKH